MFKCKIEINYSNVIENIFYDKNCCDERKNSQGYLRTAERPPKIGYSTVL